MLGKLLEGRYQVMQVLSAGGFCQTYLAQDTHISNRPTCVVKHLKPANSSPNALQTLRWLFTGEAQALEKLGCHNQIPRLLDHFEENQEFYLIQEFVQGHTLSAELQPGKPWSESQVFYMLQEVLQILEFIHSHGLIHRDIKPNNLLRRKHDRRLVLIDFGSVKQAWTQVVTLQGQKINTFSIGLPATITIGTPGYMPTEQERGKPRPNSDIYALGMVAIQALTGIHPTQLDTDPDTCEILWRHYRKISPELAQIIDNMVRYGFKDRYQSATEVLAALEPLANRYQPVLHYGFHELHGTQVQIPTVAQDSHSLLGEEETVSYSWGDRPQLQIPNTTGKATAAISAKRSTSLLDLGIGAIALATLLVGIYFASHSPTPAFKPEKYPVSIPLKSS
ncbi:protein kinase domain-containing protein [Chroococcidiopsis sp.]|uniref:protein kinase domain-containing protein n=1 Tax=Chroococcidiopsis sp. TaxID=3088168 RepID=UPI003F31960F